eukprot:6340193-Amphidinium_carterae.1
MEHPSRHPALYQPKWVTIVCLPWVYTLHRHRCCTQMETMTRSVGHHFQETTNSGMTVDVFGVQGDSGDRAWTSEDVCTPQAGCHCCHATNDAFQVSLVNTMA